MDFLVFISAFALGLSTGALIFILKRSAVQVQAPTITDLEENAKMMRQYLNFMNYDGTERGQKNEED